MSVREHAWRNKCAFSDFATVPGELRADRALMVPYDHGHIH